MSNMELKPGYFKPEVEELPSDWEPVRIGDYCDVFQGGMSKVTKQKDYQNSGVPAFSAAGQDGFVSEAEFKNKEGVILSSIGAYCGKTFFAEGDWTTLANIQAIVPKSRINPKFLYYRTNASKFWLRSGSAQPFISPKSVYKSWVAAPPLKEQKKIAELLTTVDRQIEKTEALIAKYEAARNGMMEDFFRRGINEAGKLRPNVNDVPKLYQDTSVGWIPKDWELVKFGEVFDDQLGKMLHSSEVFSEKKQYPFLANRHVQWGRVNLHDLETMHFDDNEIERFKLLPGDLLVCEGGEVARTAMWNGEKSYCFFQKAIHRLRSKSVYVSPSYVLRFMEWAKNNGWFTNFTSQTSIAHLTREKLLNVYLPLPSLKEQHNISSYFNSIEKMIDIDKKQIKNLKNIKQGLMQDLLTGKVRVNLDEAEETLANA